MPGYSGEHELQQAQEADNEPCSVKPNTPSLQRGVNRLRPGVYAVQFLRNGIISYQILFPTYRAAEAAYVTYHFQDRRKPTPPADTLKGTRS